jgi:hypothetical protein
MNPHPVWETLIYAVAVMGTPFYLLYLVDKHRPGMFGVYQPRMRVTLARQILALIFGAAAILIATRSRMQCAFYLPMALLLLGYALGGVSALRRVPGWTEDYPDSINSEEDDDHIV